MRWTRPSSKAGAMVRWKGTSIHQSTKDTQAADVRSSRIRTASCSRLRSPASRQLAPNLRKNLIKDKYPWKCAAAFVKETRQSSSLTRSLKQSWVIMPFFPARSCRCARQHMFARRRYCAWTPAGHSIGHDDIKMTRFICVTRFLTSW